jgi:addiction module HigA family antidote
MQITRRQLRNVTQGRSAVTPGMALRFEKAFGGSADMWLRALNERT